jgi:hypothetical protein
VVLRDERLLHPLRERHPLQTVFSVQKIIHAGLLDKRANAERALPLLLGFPFRRS